MRLSVASEQQGLSREWKAPESGAIAALSATVEFETAFMPIALACGVRGSKFDSCQTHHHCFRIRGWRLLLSTRDFRGLCNAPVKRDIVAP